MCEISTFSSIHWILGIWENLHNAFNLTTGSMKIAGIPVLLSDHTSHSFDKFEVKNPPSVFNTKLTLCTKVWNLIHR